MPLKKGNRCRLPNYRYIDMNEKYTLDKAFTMLLKELGKVRFSLKYDIVIKQRCLFAV